MSKTDQMLKRLEDADVTRRISEPGGDRRITMKLENNKAYDDACEKAQVAHEVFALVRQSYRAGLTDDATFLAAKAVYEKAQAEYDVAFAAASDVATTETEDSDARDESDYIDIEVTA